MENYQDGAGGNGTVSIGKIINGSYIDDNNNNNDNNRNDEDYDVQEFTGEFNGKIQKFIAKETGKYKIECWGARGGASRINGTLGYSYRKWWIHIRHN